MASLRAKYSRRLLKSAGQYQSHLSSTSRRLQSSLTSAAGLPVEVVPTRSGYEIPVDKATSWEPKLCLVRNNIAHSAKEPLLRSQRAFRMAVKIYCQLLLFPVHRWSYRLVPFGMLSHVLSRFHRTYGVDIESIKKPSQRANREILEQNGGAWIGTYLPRAIAGKIRWWVGSPLETSCKAPTSILSQRKTPFTLQRSRVTSISSKSPIHVNLRRKRTRTISCTRRESWNIFGRSEWAEAACISKNLYIWLQKNNRMNSSVPF